MNSLPSSPLIGFESDDDIDDILTEMRGLDGERTERDGTLRV